MRTANLLRRLDMKLSETLRVVSSFLLLVLCASPALAQRDSDFMTKFRQAMSINDLAEMTKIVKANEQAAILAVIETCELISGGTNDQLETDIDGLGKAWKKAYSSRFVDKQYEYFSLLSGEYKRHRAKLLESYLIQYAEFEKAREGKEKARLSGVGLEFDGLSGAFEDIGDLYMASQSAWYFAQCFDTKYQGDDADLRLACRGFGRAAEMRAKAALEDSVHDALKVRFDDLEYQGFGDPAKGPEAREKERQKADASFRPTPLGASFETVKDLTGVVRPYYSADDLYPAWAQLALAGNGSKGKFPMLGDRSPTLIREAAAKVKIDTDGDGTGDVAVPVTGKETVITIPIGDDQRSYSLLATVGQERDTFQGLQPFNLAPSDQSLTLYVAPASSIVGMLGETRLQVFDDNLDGRYGSEPLGWNFVGLRKGSSQFDVDSILIGEAKRAVPWSDLLQIGEEWYKAEPTETFDDIVLTKTEVETGTLKLDMKGLNCDYLIVRGLGNDVGRFYDVAASKRGIPVPVGGYELFAGRVSKGKRNSMMKALVLPGTSMPSYAVRAGETTVIEMGSPFGFDFELQQTDDSVTVVGASVVVTGRGRETYQRMYACVPSPEASERRAGSKKGSKGEKMRPLGSQEDLLAVNNWTYMWFPQDVVLSKKKKGEPAEVQLVEKKNKLFGKITSDWKGE